MRDTVKAIRDSGNRLQDYCWRCSHTQKFADEIGADAYARDAGGLQ